MFDKRKCAKCKYHGTLTSDNRKIICYYSILANDGTCLKRENGEVIDRRGNDPKHCRLYEKGEKIKADRKQIVF